MATSPPASASLLETQGSGEAVVPLASAHSLARVPFLKTSMVLGS